MTLGLLLLLDIDIVPDHDGENTNGKEAGSGDEHVTLSLTIRARDGISGRTAHLVRRLNDDTAIDLGEVGLRLGGKIGLESRRVYARPDCGCDGASDGASDAGECVLDCECNGDFLMTLADLYYQRDQQGRYTNMLEAFQAITCVNQPPLRSSQMQWWWRAWPGVSIKRSGRPAST